MRRRKDWLVEYLRACRQVGVKLRCAQDRLIVAQEEVDSPTSLDSSPSISSFPVEVLGEIFKPVVANDFSVPSEGLSTRPSVCAMDMALVISQVCSQWRRIAHVLPELWASIAVGYDSSHEGGWPEGQKRLVKTFLNRSRQHPLTIVYTAANDISEFTSLVLKPHASRIRHLEVTTLGPHVPSFECEDFSALETFVIEFEIQPVPASLPPSFHFFRRAPLLRDVSLFYLSIDCLAGQYSHLEHIRGYIDSPRSLYRLFQKAGGLLDATIHLRGQRFSSNRNWKKRYDPVPVHDHLRRLSLSGHPAYNMIHFTNLRYLSISFDEPYGDLLPDDAYTIPDTYDQLSHLHFDVPNPKFPIVKVIASCPTESLTSLSLVVHTHTPIIQIYHALSLYVDGCLPLLRCLEIYQPYYSRPKGNAVPAGNRDAFGLDFLVMVQSRRDLAQGTALLQTLKLYVAHELIPLSTYIALKKIKQGGLFLELSNYTLPKRPDVSME